MKKALLVLFIAVIFCAIAISQISYFQNAVYDDNYFEAAERIVFLSANEANLGIIPKQGKSLDIRFRYSFGKDIIILSGMTAAQDYYNVKDVLEIPFWDFNFPSFSYWLEYKESNETVWKSTAKRTVKTPLRPLTDKFEFIFLSDNHLSDDDNHEKGAWRIEDPVLQDLRLSSDYVPFFFSELIKNPFYTPRGELSYLMNGFCLASTLYQIQQKENPDLIFDLGDTGIGFPHKWPGLGLKDQFAATPEDIEAYEKIFRLGQRKIFSALSPNIPIYWVRGNHDQESGFNHTREAATRYRIKYYKHPGLNYGGSIEENYYYVFWGNAGTEFVPIDQKAVKKGSVLFVVLDVMRYNSDLPKKPEDWTLGIEQKKWLEKVLEFDADWKFVLAHHVLGGWPSGSDETDTSYAYGRGPLFTKDDYKDFSQNPDAIEQVGLTKLMLEKGVDAFIYGHDHIFHSKIIGINSKGRKMRSICVGSPKYVGERDWYKGAYWRKYYGDYGRYGDYGVDWASTKADFYGPSGYTKITITKNGAEVSYICSAYPHRFTNIPDSVRVGDCVQKFIF